MIFLADRELRVLRSRVPTSIFAALGTREIYVATQKFCHNNPTGFPRMSGGGPERPLSGGLCDETILGSDCRFFVSGLGAVLCATAGGACDWHDPYRGAVALHRQHANRWGQRRAGADPGRGRWRLHFPIPGYHFDLSNRNLPRAQPLLRYRQGGFHGSGRQRSKAVSH